VCKKWNSLHSDNQLWKMLYDTSPSSQYGVVPVDIEMPDKMSDNATIEMRQKLRREARNKEELSRNEQTCLGFYKELVLKSYRLFDIWRCARHTGSEILPFQLEGDNQQYFPSYGNEGNS